MRPILPILLTLAVLVAGCAETENPAPGDTTGEGGTPSGSGSGQPPPASATPSAAEAATLFASATDDLPERYGVKTTISKNGTDLMTFDAVFDGTKDAGYFKIKIDESLANDASGGMGSDMFENGEIAMYSSAEGSAYVAGDRVMLAPASEDDMMGSSSELDSFSDPAAFLDELEEDNFTVTKVTPTTLRGKGAFKLDATITDEEGTHPLTIWIFHEPRRVARVEMVAPETGDEEDAQFAGALMTMDMLYDDEIKVTIPADLTRVLGLRFESDRDPFSFGGDSDAPETWTFQVDSDIVLADVTAEVRMDMEPKSPAAWTMKLSEGTKTMEGVTLAFVDVDADGKVSKGDTLAITRGEGGEMAQVGLRDAKTGLLVTPGAGLLVAALAMLGAALLAGRRRA